MSTPEDAARRIFSERAATYTTSATHSDPQILARVVELCAPQPQWLALDVATGTGHTALALAPHVRAVVGTDLTPAMLAEAERLRRQRGIANVSFRVANAHQLPFAGGSFQLVTCRRAAHHFSQLAQALGEMHRVLAPGGRLVIDDRSVPEDDFVDRCMNQLDWLHDESHVQQYRPSQWRRLLAGAGFNLELVQPYEQHRPLSALTAGVSPQNVSRIHAILDGLTEEQRAKLNLCERDGAPHLTHWYVLLAAESA
ncbi:MAG: methyltransferase domain-containing protein [Deltaproteobacteria bacterium]|nr:methyltransferase domain-containing protein [Deltaproteobacteria bacterium]